MLRLMISEIRPLPVGAALQLALQPPAGAVRWRVLRKGTNDIGDQNDPNALLAYAGADTTIVDASPGLINQAPMFYKPFYWDGLAWTAGVSASGTPQATYEDQSTDVLGLVRDRLEEGLKVEVVRGFIRPPQEGAVQVLTVPPLTSEVDPPLVTVTLTNEDPGVRGIGELVDVDGIGEDGLWMETEGWLADVSLEVLGWSLNPEERKDLHTALRRIVVANLPVFYAAGMQQINFTAQYRDFLNGEYGPNNVFQVACSFTCQAPVRVTDRVAAITDVTVTQNADIAPIN